MNVNTNEGKVLAEKRADYFAATMRRIKALSTCGAKWPPEHKHPEAGWQGMTPGAQKELCDMLEFFTSDFGARTWENTSQRNTLTNATRDALGKVDQALALADAE